MPAPGSITPPDPSTEEQQRIIDDLLRQIPRRSRRDEDRKGPFKPPGIDNPFRRPGIDNPYSPPPL
jgi:hypothetical protein